MERAQRAGEVELAGFVGKMGRVRLDERHVPRRPLAREREQLRHPVDADDVSYQRSERKSERACPAADVERVLVTSGADEGADPLGERARPLVLLYDVPRGRSSEPVLSHRRPLSGRGWSPTRSRTRART
jgi:hypothetical protein